MLDGTAAVYAQDTRTAVRLESTEAKHSPAMLDGEIIQAPDRELAEPEPEPEEPEPQKQKRKKHKKRKKQRSERKPSSVVDPLANELHDIQEESQEPGAELKEGAGMPSPLNPEAGTESSWGEDCRSCEVPCTVS